MLDDEQVKLTDLGRSTRPAALPLTSAKADSTLSLKRAFDPQMSWAPRKLPARREAGDEADQTVASRMLRRGLRTSSENVEMASKPM